METCVAVFDIGKTNKKCVLFDPSYNIIHEIETRFPEITDDDGYPAEDLTALTTWLQTTWQALEADTRFNIVGINFTTYGASFVHLNAQNKPATHLYSYLKSYPEDLNEQFHQQYGSTLAFAAQTASPPLGMLNSGLQIYWLKYKKPHLFNQIQTSLHLPQYCAFLFTGRKVSEYTSIGCHTGLWDYNANQYHRWVYQEDIIRLLPQITDHNTTFDIRFRGKRISAGIGLHDSSAALIPYLKKYTEPFLLLSTGTWGITLNPFAKEPLTEEMLQQDCLNYFTYDGKPVRASRVFIGNEHEVQTKKLASYFQKPSDYYKTVVYDPSLVQAAVAEVSQATPISTTSGSQSNPQLAISLDLNNYSSYEEAYHALMVGITEPQIKAIQLASEYRLDSFTNLLVDGGFCKNKVFMHLLQDAFPNLNLVVSENSQGTALGAAMVLNAWS
ncbi:MAG: FGGY family carbohydrate kinase [Bacteroidota bacterium]|nr:FGGY family carbohydrate kinase [Bacteroidota bacterium]